MTIRLSQYILPPWWCSTSSVLDPASVLYNTTLLKTVTDKRKKQGQNIFRYLMNQHNRHLHYLQSECIKHNILWHYTTSSYSSKRKLQRHADGMDYVLLYVAVNMYRKSGIKHNYLWSKMSMVRTEWVKQMKVIWQQRMKYIFFDQHVTGQWKGVCIEWAEWLTSLVI